METPVYLARTNNWLHAQFVQGGAEGQGWKLIDSPLDAELVIFPVPGWRDDDAPDTLRSLPRATWPRIYLWSQEDYPLAWAPGVFASLPRRTAPTAARGGFYIPHHHV